MRLLIAEPAAADLDGILDDLAQEQEAAAERVLQAVIAAAQRLTAFPKIGRAGRVPGTRELVVPGIPFILVYEVEAGAVIIPAIFHASRDLARLILQRRPRSK